jgi:hypothetical protein
MAKRYFLVILLGVLGVRVAAQIQTLTLDVVRSQIDSFLKAIQDGSLNTPDSFFNASSLSSCELAVIDYSKHSKL